MQLRRRNMWTSLTGSYEGSGVCEDSMQHLKNCVKWRARRPLEAEAKHGIYDHVKAILQRCALRDVLGCQEGYVA